MRQALRLVAAALVAASVAVAVTAVAPRPVDAAVVRPEEGEIERLYRAVLGRAPDESGFEYWVSRRIEGVPLASIADGFVASDEYRDRFGVATDTDLVDRLYRNVLGRDGDPGGVGYWLDVLADGTPRTAVVLYFAQSEEFRLQTGTAFAPLPSFSSTVRTVDAAELGASWRPGCPVSPDGLRAVEVDHVDLDGQPRRGTIIVSAGVVDEVVDVFAKLHAARFPIASITPVDAFGADDDASMAANNSSAFNCRAVTGGTGWSRHAYGTAIDINPLHNPYVGRTGTVLPPAGEPWAERDRYHPAMIRPGDVVTRAFAEHGWRWGGDFVTISDTQHFDRR